jgi:hypothetical protein
LITCSAGVLAGTDAGSDEQQGEMELIPNTVRHRLAAQQVAGEHPDADLLNAYAENALAAQERAGISAHLARCRACRDAVLLAMPEAPTVPATAAVIPQRRWIARPMVRWLGAATAVVVVGAAVVLTKFERAPAPAGKHSEQVVAQMIPQAPSSAPVQATPAQNEVAAERMYSSVQAEKKRAHQPAMVAQKATSATLAAKSSHRDAGSLTTQPGSSAKLDRLDQYAKLQSPPQLRLDKAAPSGAIGGPIRNNIVVSQPGVPPPPPPLYNLQVQAQASTVQVAQLPTNAQNATRKISGNGNTIIDVSNAPAPQMASSSTSPSPAPTPKNGVEMMAVTRPPINAASAESSAAVISRAPGQAGANAATKPQGAVGGLVRADAYNAVPSAACAIITDGIRCVQNNHKIEFHHPGANLKVIMSQGNIVWAGGDALVHSSDGGATWSDVKKPITDTITRISIMPDSVYVGATSGPLWKTADNGATWAQASPEAATTQK